MANNVKTSMFSIIIGQHDRMLRWLGTLPFVDPDRIAFCGLSYGGETAVHVPTILTGYCLPICSGDFNGQGTFKFLHKHLKWPPAPKGRQTSDSP